MAKKSAVKQPPTPKKGTFEWYQYQSQMDPRNRSKNMNMGTMSGQPKPKVAPIVKKPGIFDKDLAGMQNAYQSGKTAIEQFMQTMMASYLPGLNKAKKTMTRPK